MISYNHSYVCAITSLQHYHLLTRKPFDRSTAIPEASISVPHRHRDTHSRSSRHSLVSDGIRSSTHLGCVLMDCSSDRHLLVIVTHLIASIIHTPTSRTFKLYSTHKPNGLRRTESYRTTGEWSCSGLVSPLLSSSVALMSAGVLLALSSDLLTVRRRLRLRGAVRHNDLEGDRRMVTFSWGATIARPTFVNVDASRP